MIKRIVIRNKATFDEQGVTMENLQKANFIYGGNACGKTTISNLLASKDLESEFPHCKIEWGDNNPLQIFVYNKDFRERNLREQNIPGVFTLGEAPSAEIEAIDALSKERDNAFLDVNKAQFNIETRNKEIELETKILRDFLWKNIYKKYESLRECLKGFMNKENFMNHVLEIFRTAGTVTNHSLEELQKRYDILYSGTEPVKIEMLPTELCSSQTVLDIIKDSLWKRKIVGSEDVPISSLIKHLGNADWVHQGQQYIEHDSNICPFCQQQTITEIFRQNLNSFFDENYLSDIEAIKSLGIHYSETGKAIIEQCNTIIKTASALTIQVIDVELFKANLSAFTGAFNANIGLMRAKYKEPGMTVELKELESFISVLEKLLSDANAFIKKHNMVIDNLSSERDKLRSDVWNFLSSLSKTEVERFKKIIEGKKRALLQHKSELEIAEERIQTLNKEITEKEATVTSIKPTIERINNALKKFGFDGFTIQPSPIEKNKYQIQRKDGSWVKNTLSEGEATFISFLYYIQLVNGSMSSSAVRTPRVLVIDDPISSLDSNVLFVVSTMIKQLLKNVREPLPGKESDIKQIILLTHNVYFHREVSFITNRKKCRADSYHWILYKKGNVSYIKPYEMDNPIKGSYDLLWKQLREGKDEMDNITIQNVMRRIIENYFVVFGGLHGRELIENSFSEDPEELTIAKSFASWYDEGSHDISDDLFVEHPEILKDKYFVVFKRIFEKLGHMAHYKMMMHEED